MLAWAVLAACLLLACWSRYAFVSWREERMRLAIPLEAGVGDAVYIGSDIGLFGGCGAAVFELMPQTRARLRTSGLHALTESMATHSRVTRRPIRHGWQGTPYQPPAGVSRGEDMWAYALSCTLIERERWNTIDAALEAPGSYFRLLDKAAVLVAPSAGIVVFVYFD